MTTNFTDNWSFHDPHLTLHLHRLALLLLIHHLHQVWPQNRLVERRRQAPNPSPRPIATLAPSSTNLFPSPDQSWKLSGIVHQAGEERFQQTTLFIQRRNPAAGREGRPG